MTYIATRPGYERTPYGIASLRPIAWTGQRGHPRVYVRRRGQRQHVLRSRTLGATESSGSTRAEEQTAATAANFIPVVGPAISAAIQIIGGLLASHHTAALQKEAASLNSGTPQFIVTIQQIMSSLNAGQISPTAAIAALQQAQTAYYSSVSGIIKKSGTCTVAANGLDAGSVDHYNCAITKDPCNAACCIGCGVVEPTVRNLTAIIQAGGGTYMVPATPANKDNPGIGATPSFALSYNGASGGGGVTGALAAMPSWVWLAGGGLLLLLLLMR